METPRNDIKKAVIKKDRLNVNFNERFVEANYTNSIAKNCDQIIHHDLKEAFNKLKLHLVVLCAQPEADKIMKMSFSSPGFHETLSNYIITGYAHDSDDGVDGVTIIGEKLLQSGKVVDLRIFTAISEDVYKYADELKIDILSCDEEVDLYLFGEKWGIKQESLDFECDEPQEAPIVEEPKKKGRGRAKKIEPPKVFDETA
ncbi:hypothetical protein [Phocaeicola sp.]